MPVGNSAATASEQLEPDEEVATITLDPQKSLFVTTSGKLVAAVELISPLHPPTSSSAASTAPPRQVD